MLSAVNFVTSQSITLDCDFYVTLWGEYVCSLRGIEVLDPTTDIQRRTLGRSNQWKCSKSWSYVLEHSVHHSANFKDIQQRFVPRDTRKRWVNRPSISTFLSDLINWAVPKLEANSNLQSLLHYPTTRHCNSSRIPTFCPFFLANPFQLHHSHP